jgi:hypothetical protein
LSYWLIRLEPPPPGNLSRVDAQDAIRTIGTNGIPQLLEWMTYEHKASRLHDLNQWMREQTAFFRRDDFERLVQGDINLVRADKVPEAFEVLGTTATPAIPELERLMQNRSKTNVSLRAMYCLGAISTNAMPTALELLASPIPRMRIAATIGLGRFSALKNNAGPAVPILLQNLQSSDRVERFFTVWALGEIKVSPELIVPALSTALTDPAIDVRMTATNALQKIAPEVLRNAPAQ